VSKFEVYRICDAGVVAAHVESEWALPIEKTNEAVAWISENLDRLFGSNTVEIHVRFVPKDGAYLSPAHAGDSVYIDANLPSTLGFSLEPFYVSTCPVSKGPPNMCIFVLL
jgi:hypothetical protein